MHKRLLLAFAALLILLIGLVSAISQPSLAQFPPGITATVDPALASPTPEPTATPALTPLPTSAAPGCATVFPIRIGSTVVVRSGVNIRTAPSPSAPWLANFPEPRRFTIQEGPVCTANYNWWRVSGHGVNGWVAERSSAMNFIIYVDPSTAAPTCSTPLRLAVGDEVTLMGGVRIRNAPGLSGLVLTVAPEESVATVLSAQATCADGYNWRRVRVTVVNFVYEGWMAEGRGSTPAETFIIEDEPDSICSPPMNNAVGDLGRVYYRDGQPKNLRAAPGYDGEILYTLVQGVPFEIIGGPVCSGNMNWWQVRIRSNIPASGWLAEGPRPNYWIRMGP